MGLQAPELPPDFHEADTKTVRRLLTTLQQRGALQQGQTVRVPAARSAVGVEHTRPVVIYLPSGQVCFRFHPFGVEHTRPVAIYLPSGQVCF